MGRKSPWTKEEYVSVYNGICNYVKRLSMKMLCDEGAESAAEAITVYKIYKCPVIYLFIHYHYGMFEDLKMDEADKAMYLSLFLPNVKYFVGELKKSFATCQIFVDEPYRKLDSILNEMCDEIIYIEDNF